MVLPGMLQSIAQPTPTNAQSFLESVTWFGTKEHSTPRRALEQSLKSEGWKLRWRKLLRIDKICSISMLYGFNTFSEHISKTLKNFLRVVYLLRISFRLETVLNHPIQRFSYIALSWNYSLLSMEPETLSSRFPEWSSRYHGANRTFGSD